MVFSEFYKFIVKKDIFTSCRGTIDPIAPLGINPSQQAHDFITCKIAITLNKTLALFCF